MTHRISPFQPETADLARWGTAFRLMAVGILLSAVTGGLALPLLLLGLSLFRPWSRRADILTFGYVFLFLLHVLTFANLAGYLNWPSAWMALLLCPLHLLGLWQMGRLAGRAQVLLDSNDRPGAGRLELQELLLFFALVFYGFFLWNIRQGADLPFLSISYLLLLLAALTTALSLLELARRCRRDETTTAW